MKKHFNYNIKNIQIKNSKSKWGHCTFDNKIMINIKLLNTKENILDYVIIHELTPYQNKKSFTKVLDESRRNVFQL